MMTAVGKRNAAVIPQTLIVAAATILFGSAVVARLLPVAIDLPYFGDASKALNVCRTTVRDVQPFLLTVFAFTDHETDTLLRHVHDTVGTSILLIDEPTAVANHYNIDVRVVLMIVDGPSTIDALINNGVPTWNQLTHYMWLVPQINRWEAETLFQAVWRQRSVANVVIVTPSMAYTYSPFRDELREHRSLDVDELRLVARRMMNDLNGHTVRICMFPTRLNAIKQPDGTYKGTDGVIVSTLAKHMNFKPVYSEPSDGRKYGWAELKPDNNVTYTGLLGDLFHNKVDMAFNGVFLNLQFAYHSNILITFTNPVMFDELCFVVPEAEQMSQWRAVFTAFDVQLWYLLAASFFLVLGAWVLIKRITHRPYSLTLLAINVFRVFLMVPLNRVPQNISERLMVVSIVLFGFIMATSLQAVMVKYLSYPKYEHNIATMQELYDTGMPVMSASTNLIQMFESDDNPLYSKMFNRFVFVKNRSRDLLSEVASLRSSAAMGRKKDLLENIVSSYVKDNEVRLHIVDDCPRAFHIVYLVRRDLPYVTAVNRMITIFVESGIVNSWFMHAKPIRPISDFHSRKYPHMVFTMKNVVIAFLCLTIGLIISGVAFLSELVYYHKFSSLKSH